MNKMLTMVIVSDMDRSVKFYRDVLGLELRFQSPEWTEFSVGPSTLALHGGGKMPMVSGGSHGEKMAGRATIGFNVENIDERHRELKGKGVRFVMEPTDTKDGIRLAIFLDPDGLALSLAQPLAAAAH